MYRPDRLIKVMLVDDSAVVRESLTQVLNANHDIQVVDACQNPYEAAQKLRKYTPDVIVLDIEMPRMDGITFLRKIMSQRPIPVIICSSMVEKGSAASLSALEYGAVDVVQKPSNGSGRILQETGIQLSDAVRAASGAKIVRFPPDKKSVYPKLTDDAVQKIDDDEAAAGLADKVIVIGASTGGTEAIRNILHKLPLNTPGIVVVQHMPKGFTASFANRLDEQCRINVKEAENGDLVMPGQALIAPGNYHTLLKRGKNHFYVEVKDGPLVSRHRPSVDVLFRSAARYAGKSAIAVILTGMGDDGASGMKEMHDTGAYTIAQDEHSCVVYGMPAVAVRLGGVDRVLPLHDIASSLISPAVLKTCHDLQAGGL